ncbi:PKD-like domain-containing protein [Mucilaginibacter sp. FT3.2]|uniref:Ig-like domain-containing protein n=1 Tax=Mucilaginibacter sp. FT3.2 TaxID=2723090 RepID=UPI00160A0E1A|nr:PKD-like domain-containing protein [Mucilaginibacter sp. FT3.2]MBB6233471.1 gliding motility-associated-like protein [Mucilaginibacter sp. FT3.2]
MKIRLLIFICLLVSLQGYSQTCTLSAVISSSEPGICAGSTIDLTATPSGGSGPYSYAWSTGETTNVIYVNKAGTYTVTVTDKTTGCTTQASIPVNVTPTPGAPTITGGGVVCQGTSAHLTITSAADSYQWYTQPSGGSAFYTGSSYDTPPINGYTVYFVEATVNACTGLRATVSLNTVSRPVPHNVQGCFGSPVMLSVSGGVSYNWYASATSTNIINTGDSWSISSLTKTVTYYVESVVNGCTSPRSAVTATLTAAPQNPTVTNNPTVCSGSVISLHADVPFGVIDWFDTPSGGTPLITSPDYTTPALTANTTYYVQTTLNNCQSSRVPVTVTVNPIPTAPAVQTVSGCYNSSVTLIASTTPGTYQWYADADGKHFLKQSTTFATPALTSNITYYVKEVNGGCTSALSSVNVVVVAPVAAPSVLTPPTTCNGTTAVLTATAPGGNYQWFQTATDNNLLSNSNEFTTPPLTGTTTYYVQTTIGSCTSSRTAVKVTVLPKMTSPVAHDTSICAGNPVTLTATGPDGDYTWYDAGKKLQQIGRSYSTPTLTAATTYYVQVTNSGCSSDLVPVNIGINPPPQVPSVGPAPTICPGEKATLSASTIAGQNIEWYEVPAGGSLLHTGSTYTTDFLFANKTYYVQSTSGGCVSSRTPIDVIVKANGTSFQYLTSTISTNAGNQTPTITNPSGSDVFSAPAGIVFISTTTGEINIGASKPGTYRIILTGPGTCSGSYIATITITDKPVPDFMYDSPICQDAGNQKPIFAPGASAGVFTVAPAGLVFISKGTGEIAMANTRPGTYTITNTIPASGTFPGAFSFFKITIAQSVVVSAGSNRSLPVNTPVALNGSVTGAPGGVWSGGAGHFSNVNDLHATYTPAVDEGIAKLTLLSVDPTGACGPKSATIIITYNTIPPAPTAKGADICIGTTATLNAIAQGGSYHWYADAVGGTSLKDNASFQTPALTATTTYYVATTVNGLTSNRTPVKVSVFNAPPTPVVAADTITICNGNIVTLKASGSVGTYQWFNESGQQVATGDSLVTSLLTNSTFFTVQAAIGSCVSTPKKITVVVTTVPYVTSGSADFICGGNPLNYTITANIPTATFLWSRAAVAGISNPAVSNQTSTSITDVLINTTANPINATYAITPFNGSCTGMTINYVVTVYPTPVVTSAAIDTICYGSSTNYAIHFNTATTIFSWGRDAIPGISNATVTGQAAGVIREVLYNTTNAPVDVTYTINYKTSDCDGVPFKLIVTINPQLNITSDTVSLACNKTPQGYTITSNVAVATFSWKRGVVAGISNPVATGTGNLIDETLINTTTSAITTNYIITPMAYGCEGAPFNHFVVVNPKPDVPVANSNSPVCVGSTIQLRTPSVFNAKYMWTGPNGYSSTLQNPNIPATADISGTYNLFVTVGNCTSDASPVTVQVNQPPVAKANGPSLVCPAINSILLTGSVTGGTSTGVWSSSNLKGKFLPSSTQVDNVTYIPTAEEKTAGSVTITLSSTSKDDCTISTSSVLITYGKDAGIDAGPSSMNVCSQDASVHLNGKILAPVGTGFWSTTSKDGVFESGNQSNATYLPGASDKKNGSVVLTYNLINSGDCYTQSDSIKIIFFGPAALTTEKTRYVLKDKTITLHPTVSDEKVTYLWSPNIGIGDIHAKEPVITGTVDTTYTLVITDSLGCTTAGTTHIVVSPQLTVSNAFSPNGDGTNDNWEIVGLVAFENSTVDVFNRYGSLIFHSKGYGTPWDGRSNGQPVPVGVYYYIVDTKVNGQRFTGYVTVLR